MKFDLFYELSVPPNSGLTENQVFHNSLTELEHADTLLFNTIWLVEHHFMREYSHSSAPTLFLAAASQRTKRLRLGHGIIPLPYHHPIQVAEQLATLDQLSNGRVEFGFGRGFSPKEYEAFGVSMAESRTRTEESLNIILESFKLGPVKFKGQHFSVDSLEILPKPLQQPHPPVWMAAVSPESFEMAARLGVGALAGPFKPWFMVKEDIKLYQKTWRQVQNTNHLNKPRVGMTVGVLCLEDESRARKLAKPVFEWFYQELLNQTRPVLSKLYNSYEYYKRWGLLNGIFDKAVHLRLLETMDMVVVGNPETCKKKFRMFQKQGVDHILCAVGAGALPTEIIQESMTLLSEEVIPEFDSHTEIRPTEACV
ncbi:MAG: LLM class flavin-dependent oxidoreductase [Gammaproteobacteria bacterium]|nr:LLM class flavin-dependent oxidoreductase [Gammaproteobacteria bacterium]MDH5693126.1 LLM class flavin-dependent oxidoreductase [Gammaproteobacteria bacterium]